MQDLPSGCSGLLEGGATTELVQELGVYPQTNNLTFVSRDVNGY